MKSLVSALATEKNKLFSTYPWVPLVQFAFASPVGTIYLCKDLDNITYGGQTYTKFAMEVEFQDDSQGKLPECVIRLSNVSRVIEAYLQSLDGAVDTVVTLTFVNTDNLTEDYSDLSWSYYILGTESDENWITFSLGIYNLLEKPFPNQKYQTLTCRYRTFKGLECSYSGPYATCDRSYDACTARNNTDRFGGFLGLSDKSVSFLLSRI